MNNDNQNLDTNRDPLIGTLVGARCLTSHQPV